MSEYLIVSQAKVTILRFVRSLVIAGHKGVICPDADEEYFGSCGI